MIENLTINSLELDYIFGGKEREIEIKFGSVQGEFWGDNISMVSAIVGKNGTGKSSILRSIKNRRINAFPYNHEDNTIYYSPHLDYIDNYNFDVDPNDISLDTILRRDLENIIDDEKEPSENGWNLNIKQDLEHLNTSRQLKFLSSSLREQNLVFASIFEKLKFKIGTVILRGSIKQQPSKDSFHNTPYEFREIILDIFNKCEAEVDSWVKIRRMEGKNVLNQHEINIYIFKRNLISSFLTIVIDLMEKNNTFLSEGVIDKFEKSNYTAIELFRFFITNSKVHFNGQSASTSKNVFNPEVLELFRFIYELVDEIQDYNSVKNKSFNAKYYNLEKIENLQNSIINHLSNNYYNQKVRVSSFLGIKSTDRKLSSGENALLNFYSVLYERVTNIDEEQILNEYILLLDEADLGYHPEWKKKFVNSIVKSLPLFFIFSNNQSRIQIIFTTHDPLTLSDIPRENVIFLDKNEEGFTIVSNHNIKTFGANIHDLLADSFFISDGLMGDFAKEKIQDLILFLTFDEKLPPDLDNKSPIDSWDENTAMQLIEIVGEPVIQDRLQSLFDSKFNISEKEDLQSKINELQQKLNELNEKNSDR